MNRIATIVLKSMFVRGDGDTDFFFAENDPGDLFYTITVEKVNASGVKEKVLEVKRTKANLIHKFAGSTISQDELTSGQVVPAFKEFALEPGSTFNLHAQIEDDDDPSKGDFAQGNRPFPETFLGDFPNETLRMTDKGNLDIDLLYSVRVTEIPQLVVPPDPLKDAGITQGAPEVGLKGVEMFTERKFQLPLFGHLGGFSQVFPVGKFPSLPPSEISGSKPAPKFPGGTSPGLKNLGVTDNSISSIKVGAGFQVLLFMEPNFQQITPPTITLTGNVADLGRIWDNKISSFIVSEIPGPPH